MKIHLFIYAVVLLCICSLVWSQDDKISVLLVTNEMWEEGDSAVLGKMEGLGFEVTTAIDTDVDSTWAAGMDFIYVSSTVSSGNITNKFKNVPIPVIMIEPYALDDMGMSLDTDTTRFFQAFQRNMIILKEDHFLSAGLTGEVVITDSLEIQSGQGYPGPGGVVIAEYTRDTTDVNMIYGAIFAYEKGAILADSTVAAERRYFAGWNDKCAGYFTEDGWKLWQAAIDWCLYKDKETVVDDVSQVTPAHFRLSQNYPNPFNNSTVIKYDLAKKGHMLLDVLDIQGRRVARLVNTTQDPGSYWSGFDAGGLAAGIYFIELRMDGQSQMIKMMLLK
jgi:hypothetical protein